MLPSKFGVNWPFGSGEEAKNIFSRWLPWRPSWISDQSRQSVGPGSSRPKKFKTQPSAGKVTATEVLQEKKQKIDFQDGCHLGFPIRMILAIFDLLSHPNASSHVWSQFAFRFRRRSNK